MKSYLGKLWTGMMVMTSVVAGGLVGSDNALADGAQLGNVAHQAIHRVQKFAQTGVLDASFLNNLNSVALTTLSPAQGDAVYQVTLRQVAGADGTSQAAVLLYDVHGKNLSHTVVNGAAPAAAPAWPDKESVELAENGFHYLIAQVEGHPELAQYLDHFQSLTLTPKTDAKGQVTAQVDFQASTTASVLRVVENTAGDVLSGTVIP